MCYVLLPFILTFLPSFVFAAGFLIYNQDAKANGMGMACVSSIDNASSVFYNPANLLELEKEGFSINMTLIKPDLSFKNSVSGKSYETKSKTHSLLSLYGYHTGKKISFGLGVFSPFGLSVKWKNDFPGRYYSLLSELETLFINPVLGLKLNERTNLAFGVSYVLSSIKFKTMVPTPLGIDGLSSLSGRGEGIGYNMAALLKLPKGYFFSLVFRSPVRIDYKGRGKIFMPAPIPSFSTECRTTLELPYLLVSGLAKRFGNTTFELDVLYTGWSSMNTYRIRSENGLLDRYYHKGWSNTFSFCGGLNHKMAKGIEIQIGYMYDITPVPLSTRGPELPDATRHIFTAGTSYERRGLKASISYQATFFKKAKSHLPYLSGRYSNFAHLLLINLGYSR
ncbi:MAG: outer membrane protein transport protein [Desulfobacterota bacterium]|nr:outer membrane protein transport protein [Thermodesulfobacteriota bacterium]